MDIRDKYFLGVMIALGIIGLAAFLLFLIVRHSRGLPAAGGGPAAAGTPQAGGGGGASVPPAALETPAAGRLGGLALLALLLLLLAWVYLPRPEQFRLMQTLLYPGTFVLALVFLFDKASRAWHVKKPGETPREWLFANTLTLLLILWFLNLKAVTDPEKYNVFFWDMVHLLLFIFIFWLLDRTRGRFRFLAAYAYLVWLPILLLIWEAVLGVPAAETFSFWESRWPFFFWALLFFFLEIILTLITRETEAPTLAIAKDVVFLAIYAILLIVAIPGATEGG